jgi:hypothetical protein
MIARLDTRIDEACLPFAHQLQLLTTIPGIGERSAQVIISEIGVEMSRFPTAAHLASWAGLCPGNNESAGKHHSGRARKGSAQLRASLVESAWAAGRTSTYTGAQFRRFHRRFGKQGGKKAAVATAHTLIVIIWHVLAENTAYRELGADYFTRRMDHPDARQRRLVRELETLGHKVTLEPATGWPLTNIDHRPTRPGCRVTDPCLQNAPGYGSYISASPPIPGWNRRSATSSACIWTRLRARLWSASMRKRRSRH